MQKANPNTMHRKALRHFQKATALKLKAELARMKAYRLFSDACRVEARAYDAAWEAKELLDLATRPR